MSLKRYSEKKLSPNTIPMGMGLKSYIIKKMVGHLKSTKKMNTILKTEELKLEYALKYLVDLKHPQ